jgi:hypothetical protein
MQVAPGVQVADKSEGKYSCLLLVTLFDNFLQLKYWSVASEEDELPKWQRLSSTRKKMKMVIPSNIMPQHVCFENPGRLRGNASVLSVWQPSSDEDDEDFKAPLESGSDDDTGSWDDPSNTEVITPAADYPYFASYNPLLLGC